jgi:hypothetical protein
MTRKCSVDGCGQLHYAKGYCNRHWQRLNSGKDTAWALPMRAPNGAPRAWIREHASYAGVKCVIWPFARRQNGWPKMASLSPAKMMCELSHGKSPSKKHQVAHSCGRGHEGCLSPKHIRWATSKENNDDKIGHGTLLRGTQIKQAKLSERDVIEIRALAHTMSHSYIASQLGVSRPTISRAIAGKTWRHVA